MSRSAALALAWLPVALLLVVAGAGRGQQKVQDHDFIGADRCRSCHAEEFEAWAKSPHARAFDVLAEKDRRDPRCLSCHTMNAEDTSLGLTGVQCEACHGPGRHYAIDYVMRDAELRAALNLARVDEATCLRCHTDSSPSLTQFVYQDKVRLIAHGKMPR